MLIVLLFFYLYKPWRCMPMWIQIHAVQERVCVMAAGEEVGAQDLSLRGPWV